MGSFVKADYNREYNRSHYTSISFRLNTEADADLLKWLKAQGNTTEFIRRLLRSDMKRSQRRHKWHLRGGSFEHDHVKAFPFEVVEKLPNNDYYSIGFASTIDDAALLIMNYCQRIGTPEGELIVLKRFVGSLPASGKILVAAQPYGY